MISRNRNLAESLNVRAHHKKSASSPAVFYENGRNADHTMKDTSRQNRIPLSGLERSRNMISEFEVRKRR